MEPASANLRRAVWMSLGLFACAGEVAAQVGVVGAHDPSRLNNVDSRFYYFATGQGIVSRSSVNQINWVGGPSVFDAPPAWTTSAVPGFDGFFWAPDVIYRNNQYYLYYSVSTWGSQVSAIGLATSTTLNPGDPNYGWTDQGPVIQSGGGSAYNAIDASILQDTDGRMWMTFGSYWDGIFLTELNPTTGKRLSTSVAPTRLADNSSIEASYLHKKDGYYYLFVNWGTCCDGVNSTYNIRVGRSTSITGPYRDRNGVNMTQGGGSLFLAAEGNRIGPGHLSIYSQGDFDQFTYHYYDANQNGAPTFGLRTMYWDAFGWPSATPISPDWTGAANSNWSSAGNWSSSLPNGKGHTANFVGNSADRYDVALDGGPKTVGNVVLNAPAGYRIGDALGFSLILDATLGNAGINVSGGSHSIAAPIILNDDLNITVSGGGFLRLGAMSAAGRAVQKFGGGTVEHPHVRAAALNINDGVVRISEKHEPNWAGGTSVVQSLAIAPAGELDLTNNSLIVDYAIESPLAQLAARVGIDIVTSIPGKTIGIGEASELGLSSFAGFAVDSTAVVLRMTLFGDADLDGDVDGIDVGRWARHFTGDLGGAGTMSWTDGDWDHDGDVDGVDVGLWAQNFTGELGGGLSDVVVTWPADPRAAGLLQSLGITLIPDPAAPLAASTLAALLLARRRNPAQCRISR